jgi:hypothetical protein
MTGSDDVVEHLVPVPRPDLLVHPLDDELVILDPLTSQSFILNATGRAIWALCDGVRTVSDITAEFADQVGITPDQASIDVREWLDRCMRANLLQQQ